MNPYRSPARREPDHRRIDWDRVGFASARVILVCYFATWPTFAMGWRAVAEMLSVVVLGAIVALLVSSVCDRSQRGGSQ